MITEKKIQYYWWYRKWFFVIFSMAFLGHLSAQKTVMDTVGNVYKIVTIGNQTWMAENLKTSKYNDGKDIPYIEDDYDWTKTQVGAYCWYNNDTTFGEKLGALYNGFAVDEEKLCPNGWHIPSDEEWTELESFFQRDKKNKTAGYYLKSKRKEFKALPGGYRLDANGLFNYVTFSGFWWTSTEADPEYNESKVNWIRGLFAHNDNVCRDYHSKNHGHSVRCIQDPKPIEYGTVSDLDGNSYKTVVIGKQTWMAENLKTTKYNDGTTINLLKQHSPSSDSANGVYCWFNHQSSYKKMYGALYDWYAINTKKLCPSGWHVPSDVEWKKLINYIKEEGHALSEGTILKSDQYGFSAVSGGCCYSDGGTFNSLGSYGYWWSSSENGILEAWSYNMYYEQDYVGKNNFNKHCCLSVRCVRN
ncbi:MAG: fibrobacter succinogenes major paralogous domain-containing protein [Bacteroidales bacterium]|nr:fibrobacter succinogenes major paralogous domain-containing protein [Bacteroidales bacterium]